jgi:hypothetical protein
MSITTEPDELSASDPPLEAWNTFCDELKSIGAAELASGAANEVADKIDGLRRLLGLTVDGLNWYLHCSDPDFPRFGQVRDTPEIADYWYAPVRGHATYLIKANISTVFDINVSIVPGRPWGQWTNPSSRAGASPIVGDLGRAQLEVSDDGRFELIVSAEQPENCINWLPLPAEGGLVTIREYFYDWATESPGDYEIARVGSEIEAPIRQSNDAFAKGLAGASEFIRCYHANVVKMMVPEEPNTLGDPKHASGGNGHIWYSWGRFDLGPDDAMLLEFEETVARAWCIQWLTDPWYSNPDMVNRTTSLMGHEMVTGKDGRVTVVVSATDPGMENWLDVSNYRRGVIATRWIWCEEPPRVKTETMTIAEIARRLSDSPQVNESKRSQQRAMRRSHLAKRRR